MQEWHALLTSMSRDDTTRAQHATGHTTIHAKVTKPVNNQSGRHPPSTRTSISPLEEDQSEEPALLAIHLSARSTEFFDRWFSKEFVYGGMPEVCTGWW